LKQAEAIWLSKARIANADTTKIWQQITYIKKSRKTLNKIENAISNPKAIENYLVKVSITVSHILKYWRNFFGDIYYREVIELEEKVIKTSVSRIERIIDDRLKLAIETIEAIIAFYSQLLEKQNRYLKETSEQPLVEKDWIDRQKEMLLTLQVDLNSIIEY
jgi:hypothetical protein